LLQREARDASPWLGAFAYLTVLSLALGLLGMIAWGLRRLAFAGRAEWRREPSTLGSPRPRSSGRVRARAA